MSIADLERENIKVGTIRFSENPKVKLNVQNNNLIFTDDQNIERNLSFDPTVNLTNVNPEDGGPYEYKTTGYALAPQNSSAEKKNLGITFQPGQGIATSVWLKATGDRYFKDRYDYFQNQEVSPSIIQEYPFTVVSFNQNAPFRGLAINTNLDRTYVVNSLTPSTSSSLASLFDRSWHHYTIAYVNVTDAPGQTATNYFRYEFLDGVLINYEIVGNYTNTPDPITAIRINAKGSYAFGNENKYLDLFEMDDLFIHRLPPGVRHQDLITYYTGDLRFNGWANTTENPRYAQLIGGYNSPVTVTNRYSNVIAFYRFDDQHPNRITDYGGLSNHLTYHRPSSVELLDYQANSYIPHKFTYVSYQRWENGLDIRNTSDQYLLDIKSHTVDDSQKHQTFIEQRVNPKRVIVKAPFATTRKTIPSNPITIQRSNGHPISTFTSNRRYMKGVVDDEFPITTGHPNGAYPPHHLIDTSEGWAFGFWMRVLPTQTINLIRLESDNYYVNFALEKVNLTRASLPGMSTGSERYQLRVTVKTAQHFVDDPFIVENNSPIDLEDQKWHHYMLIQSRDSAGQWWFQLVIDGKPVWTTRNSDWVSMYQIQPLTIQKDGTLYGISYTGNNGSYAIANGVAENRWKKLIVYDTAYFADIVMMRIPRGLMSSAFGDAFLRGWTNNPGLLMYYRQTTGDGLVDASGWAQHLEFTGDYFDISINDTTDIHIDLQDEGVSVRDGLFVRDHPKTALTTSTVPGSENFDSISFSAKGAEINSNRLHIFNGRRQFYSSEYQGGAFDNTLTAQTVNRGIAADFRSDIRTTGIIYSSDQRIKKNVEDHSLEKSLRVISSVQPKEFEYIPEYDQPGRTIGFIAQELEAVSPDLVVTEDVRTIGSETFTNFKNIDREKLYMMTIQTVQHLLKENALLKERLDRLESNAE